MNNITRRASEFQVGLDMARISSLTRKLHSAGDSAEFDFVYEDEDGDRITVSTNEELKEAISIMQQVCGKSTLNFTVNIRGEKAATPVDALSSARSALASEETKSAELDHALHTHVTCDECGAFPIEGTRYKCSVREDFDLCSTCEKRSTQPFPMIAIYKEEQAPTLITTIQGDDREWRRHPHHRAPPFRRMMRNSFGHPDRRGPHHEHGRGPPPHGDRGPPHGPPPHGARGPPHCARGTRGPLPFHESHGPRHLPPFSPQIEDEIMRDVMKESVEFANAVPTPPGAGKPMCRFVKDLTFPDSSEVAPGLTFEKVWLVRNDGEVPWPPSSLTFVSGDDLSVNAAPVPDNVAPGQEVPLTVQMTAPLTEGRFVSYFRLQNTANEVSFGQRFWCDVRVKVDEPSSEADTACGATFGDDLPRCIAEAISSVVSGGGSPHDALGKLLKTWQMVQQEDSTTTTPAVAMPKAVPTPNNALTASSNGVEEAFVDENVTGPEDDWQSLWSNEVTLLAAMGFEPFGDVLPLLEQFLVIPLSLQPSSIDGTIDPEGFQKVVIALLAARARDAEAAASSNEKGAS